MVNMQKYYKAMQWIGGKFRLQEALLSLLPHSDIYCEPFMGSAVTYLNRTIDKINIMSDIDGTIVNLWKVIADDDMSDKFKHEFCNIPVDKNIFDSLCLVESSDDADVLDRAIASYYRIVYSFNGNRTNMRYGTTNDKWNHMQAKCIRELNFNWTNWRLHAKNAKIVEENALVILEELKDMQSAVIFIDSPYVKELLGVKKDLYKGKFNDEEQIKMLETIKDSKAKIVVCGYRGGSYLYDLFLNRKTGWHCYCINNRLVKACKTGEKKGFAQEYIWTNFDVPDICRYKFALFDLAK